MIRKIKGFISILDNAKFLFFISAFSLIKCLLLFLIIEVFLTPDIYIGYFPDSGMYETLADNLLSGRGFSLSLSAPFVPYMFKEPLYSFFIAIVKFILHSINYIVFIQILFNPLIAVLIYLIGKEIFNEKIARISAILVVLIPVYGEISFFIMPEFLFILLFFASILCLIKAVKSKRWILFILSGFLLGLASLCRNAALPLFFIYPLTILFINRREINKGMILNLVTFVLSTLIVTTPWMIRNQQKLGLFSISRRGGELLADQAFWAANFSADEWKAYSLYLLSGRLAQKLYPQIIGDNLGDYEYAVLFRTPYVESLLKKYRAGEVETLLVGQAINDIKSQPFKYLLLSGIIYVQTFKYFESIALMLIRGQGIFGIILPLIRFLLFLIGIAYTFITFWGILCSRRSFKYWSILVITIIYFHIVLTSIGIIPGGLQRHILPISVFYSFFVAIVIDKKTRCEYF